ncbi:hypothetical protein FDP41_009304 [Naegleria fowleri]|uniref:Uncharacterized protein n=1 Tax=Naegleria fowleri TaxID=5763 RepID=A0A6A5BCK5_NAEFO|nr:uncharacterized protein FDP41_009304 [Naegleria fowleri]KAF0972401.1 hypothetical protein FDP41_009304 [Naegleria fowleri]
MFQTQQHQELLHGLSSPTDGVALSTWTDSQTSSEPFDARIIYRDDAVLFSVNSIVKNMDFDTLIKYFLHEHFRCPIPEDVSSYCIRYYDITWAGYTSAFSNQHLSKLWESVYKARNRSGRILQLIENTNNHHFLKEGQSKRITLLTSPSKNTFKSSNHEVAVETCGSPGHSSSSPSPPPQHIHESIETSDVVMQASTTTTTTIPCSTQQQQQPNTTTTTTSTFKTVDICPISINEKSQNSISFTCENEERFSTTPTKARRRRRATTRVKIFLEPTPQEEDVTANKNDEPMDFSFIDNIPIKTLKRKHRKTTTPTFETLPHTEKSHTKEIESSIPKSEAVPTTCGGGIVKMDESYEPILEVKTSRMRRKQRKAKTLQSSKASDSQTNIDSSDPVLPPSETFEKESKKPKANPTNNFSCESLQMNDSSVDGHHQPPSIMNTSSEKSKQENNDMMNDDAEDANSSQQVERPQIFTHRVNIFPRKMECDSITNFIETQFFNHDLRKNVLYVYGTNGQGKSLVVSSIFDSVIKVDKYKFNLAGYAKGSDLLLLLFQNIVKGEISRKSELAPRLLSHFNNRKKPVLIYLDEFSFTRHSKYLDQIRKSKIIVIAVTNDPPTKSALPYSLTFNQYESEDIKKILISEYEGKISVEIFDKMMNYLKNKQDLRQIKSFVDGHLMPEAKTLTVKRMLQLCTIGFRKKHDPLKGLTQTAIEILVVLSCVAAEQEKFYGEIDAESFQRKYEQVLQEDFRKNFGDIKDGLVLLTQEGHITRKNVAL